VQSKAHRNQLNLPHGTKTKPDMLKIVSIQSQLCQSGRKRQDLWLTVNIKMNATKSKYVMFCVMFIDVYYYLFHFSRFSKNQFHNITYLDFVAFIFGRPYYRSSLWYSMSSVCLSVCLSSVCLSVCL